MPLDKTGSNEISENNLYSDKIRAILLELKENQINLPDSIVKILENTKYKETEENYKDVATKLIEKYSDILPKISENKSLKDKLAALGKNKDILIYLADHNPHGFQNIPDDIKNDKMLMENVLLNMKTSAWCHLVYKHIYKTNPSIESVKKALEQRHHIKLRSPEEKNQLEPMRNEIIRNTKEKFIKNHSLLFQPDNDFKTNGDNFKDGSESKKSAQCRCFKSALL